MKIEKNYRKSLLIAVIFHVALLCFLILNFAPSVFRAPSSGAPMKTIQAKAISESAVREEVQKINQQRAAVEHEKVVQQQKIAEQKEAVEKAKEAQVAHAALVQKEKAAAVVAAKQALILKENQAAALKIQEAKAAAQKAAAKKIRSQALARAQAIKAAQKRQRELARASAASKLVAEQKKLQQQMIQQQISSEAKNISQIQTQQQQRGEINKYKAEILALIQSNWRIDQVNDKLKCIYDVSVAPDGTILSVTLKQSSGSGNLDESARQAIMASSPLPVPQSAVLFNHFRQLVLTLSPQGILQSIGTL